MNQDPETGLLSDAAFQARIGRSVRRRQSQPETTQFAILSVQLDRVAEVRDTLGAETADRLTQAAAERLNGCVRARDLVCRVEGAHFRVQLDALHSPELAASIADKLCQVLRMPFTVLGETIRLSASVGISLFPHDSRTASTLIDQADRCMRQATSIGDHFQFRDCALATSLGHLVDQGVDPRDGLAKEEFELHYQPRVDLGRDSVISAEALIRWRHPVRGLIPPSDFIPLAESTGLIHELGAWVLDHACMDNAAWLAAGHTPIQVSVNVSARQLDHPEFPELVARILHRTGLPPRLLELEITESAIMRRPEDVAETLKRIRALGVQVALDDFGTGQSSLAYLRHFPLDTLKIDRSFILDLSLPDQNVVLLRSIIDLAHALELRVVAEGVETAPQRAMLKAQGCDEIQGFLISPALPATQFVERFLARRAGAQSFHKFCG